MKRKILVTLGDDVVERLDETAAALVELVGRDLRTQRPNRSAVLRALIATADVRKLRRHLKQQSAA